MSHNVIYKKDITDKRRIKVTRVQTLQFLAMRSYIAHLEQQVHRIVRRQRLGMITPPLQHTALITRVPYSLRQQMLDFTLSSGRLYDLFDMLMVEALLDSTTRHVEIRQIRSWYRPRFLSLLKNRGSGITYLSLEEIRVSPDCDIITLALALSSMTHLRFVSVRFHCDNAALWSLGQHCSFLEELDVEGSMDVTDVGLRALCFRDAIKPVQQQNPTVPELHEPRNLFCLRCTCNVFEQCTEQIAPHSINNSHPSVIGMSWWRASLMKGPKMNPCCQSLKYLNFKSTGVTNKGANVLLDCCSKDTRIDVAY